MKNLAIIGASYLQLPLIKKAKEMGFTTHVFAWKANDVGEKEADCFYPISIVEKEQILGKCKEIKIDGICSIASDLAIITVNFVAQNMGLISNSLYCTSKSTNKHLMRRCFEENGDPSPKSFMAEDVNDLNLENLQLPLIVKPLDRSGSRGISKIFSLEELPEAIEKAKNEGFLKKALVEEFAEGQEYSVECISWKGKHQLLQITKKFTTGSPHFIETGHLEPAELPNKIKNVIKEIVFRALNSLEIEYGASHTEIKIDNREMIKIIEIGGRMGGDFIGSNLVYLSTGYDFVKEVIKVSLGMEPSKIRNFHISNSAVGFIFNRKDIKKYKEIERDHEIEIIDSNIQYDNIDEAITDSSNRHGYYIIKSDNYKAITKYFDDETNITYNK